MTKIELVLSTLGKTWLIDLDGTLVKHNGYLEDKHDTLLDGVSKFMNTISPKDKIIFLTSRKKEYAELTENFLKNAGIRFDYILYELPFGERILINDCKPSKLKMAYSINVERDSTIDIELIEDPLL